MFISIVHSLLLIYFYASPHSFVSGYIEDYWSFVGVSMHELGHNLKLAHSSGLDGGTYSDLTCLMGSAYYSNSEGSMCYNPAKTYQLARGSVVGSIMKRTVGTVRTTSILSYGTRVRALAVSGLVPSSGWLTTITILTLVQLLSNSSQVHPTICL